MASHTSINAVLRSAKKLGTTGGRYMMASRSLHHSSHSTAVANRMARSGCGLRGYFYFLGLGGFMLLCFYLYVLAVRYGTKPRNNITQAHCHALGTLTRDEWGRIIRPIASAPTREHVRARVSHRVCDSFCFFFGSVDRAPSSAFPRKTKKEDGHEGSGGG